MDKLLHDVIDWIKCKDEIEPLVIGISGHGAAGKTTFANKIINFLDKNKVNYINTDPYIVDSNIRKYAIINYIYQAEDHQFKMTACHPSAHHLPALERDIQMVKAGLDLNTIDTHYMASTLISSNNKITIIEGMSVAFINPKLFDLTIYFYTDGETELIRRESRDVTERGADFNYLKKSHQERRIQYEVFMHQYCQGFDIIIKNDNKSFSLEKSIFV